MRRWHRDTVTVRSLLLVGITVFGLAPCMARAEPVRVEMGSAVGADEPWPAKALYPVAVGNTWIFRQEGDTSAYPYSREAITETATDADVQKLHPVTPAPKAHFSYTEVYEGSCPTKATGTCWRGLPFYLLIGDEAGSVLQGSFPEFDEVLPAHPGADMNLRGTWTVTRVKEIVVPAGHFHDCFETTLRQTKWPEPKWRVIYCPGTGPVFRERDGGRTESLVRFFVDPKVQETVKQKSPPDR